MNGRVLIRTLAALVAAGMTIGYANARSDQAVEERAPLATPLGITVQPLGKAQGYALDKQSATLLVHERIAYTGPDGMTLYYNDMDPPGQSVCVDECAEKWPPSLAPAYAQPYGDWSIIQRDDGSRQWAYKDKPLYTYSEDVGIGAYAGNSPYLLARGPNAGPRGSYRGERPEEKPVPERWRIALMFPVNDVILPPGFAIKDIPDALGLVFVNSTGQTLYTFNGDVNEDSRACASVLCAWRPLAAPQIAGPIGDFGFVRREDGIRQWTYKGQPLYTHLDDRVPGDAFGIEQNEHWQVAHHVRYFMPETVRLQNNRMLGKILATKDGQTLYKRDGYIFQSGGGHGLRRGAPNRPAVGRDIGTDARCMVECEKWHPFLASNDAKPSGNWNIATRDDGSRQWVYRGHALWTYGGDNQPGSMHAHDSYDIALSDDSNTEIDIGTPYDGVGALYWSAVYP